MAPFDFIAMLGKFLGYGVYLLVGVGFGAVLEMSGFGDSRKLAGQFYLKDMTVLKVMFTAIIVAMVLIFSFSAMGLLDFSRVFVNPTYLWPGIIGGIIMGFGFIIGGFCPGTSLVAASTLKIDGMFFLGGVTFGIFLFGETVSLFQDFFNSSYMGRFILPQLFQTSTGLVVLLVVLMALIMFYWAEISEKYFGEHVAWKNISLLPSHRGQMIASAALVCGALFVWFVGLPTPEDKWNWIKNKEISNLEKREMYVHPGELLETMNDPLLYTTLLDIRSESDYNLFHLKNARHVRFEYLYDDTFIKQLTDVPPNMVMVVMSNNETAALRAYKLLKSQGVLNLYILSGGVNHWLKLFPLDTTIAHPRKQDVAATGEELNYRFTRAVGASQPSANPDLQHEQLQALSLQYTKHIKMQKKKTIAGGCG